MKKCWNLGVLSACVIMTLLASPALARNWVQIGDGHYIDAESIRPTAYYGSYTMDTKYIARNTPLEVVNNVPIWTIKTHSYIDCKSAYAKTLSYTALDSNDRTVITDRNIGKQWFGINNPGSRANESYLFVCTDKYLNVRPGYRELWWY